LIGGIAGGIAASIGDSGQLSSARDHANECRERSYGLSIVEREKDFPGSFSYKQEQVKKLDYDAKELCLTVQDSDGKKMQFYIPNLTQDAIQIIQTYPTDGSCYDTDNDPHGLKLGCISPKQLSVSLLDDTKENINDFLTVISKNERYMFAFLSQTKKMVLDNQRKAVETLKILPNEFRAALREATKKDLNIEGGNLFMAIMMLFSSLGLIGLFYDDILNSIQNGIKWEGAVAIFAFMSWIFLRLTLLFNTLRQR
jgi:hypothetical protein